MKDKIQKQAVTGIAWRGFSTVTLFVLGIAITLTLMQYVLPSDYGVVAKLIIVISFCNVFINLGFSQALVQQMTYTQKNLTSHFYVVLLIGFTVSLLLFFASNILANFLKSPEIVFPLRLLSVSLFIGSSILVHRSILHREMKFKTIAIIDLSSLIVSGIIAIVLAIKNYGYMAIVAQMLVQTIFQVLLYWMYTPFKPLRFYFNREDIRSTSTFSGLLFLNELMGFFADLLDQFLVSLKFDQAQLGVYNRSISLIRTPTKLIPSSFQTVLFPLFSRMQESENDKPQIDQIYYRITGLITLLFIPLLALLFCYLEPIVLLVLGESWAEIIPFAKILCLIGGLQLFNLENSLFLSHRKAKKLLGLQFVDKTLMILAILIGIQNGLINLLYALFIAECCSRIVHLIQVQKVFGIEIIKYLSAILSSLLIAGIFVALSYFCIEFLQADGIGLLLALLICYLCYLAINLLTGLNTAGKDLRRFYEILMP